MFEWITGLIEGSGYFGVAFGMFLENVFPPIPSELMMIFSGAAAAEGQMNIYLVILAAIVGSTVGLLPWYGFGKLLGKKRLKRLADKYGRLLTFDGSDIETADDWFERHGRKIVLFGRAIPAVRTLVAIPAAILEMPLWEFALFAAIGSLLWDGLFGALGFVLGENSAGLTTYIDVGTYIAFAVVLVWYAYRVSTFKKGRA